MFSNRILIILIVAFLECYSRKFHIDEFPECPAATAAASWVDYGNCHLPGDCKTTVVDIENGCRGVGRAYERHLTVNTECVYTYKTKTKWNPKWWNAGLGWKNPETINVKGSHGICGAKTAFTSNRMNQLSDLSATISRHKQCEYAIKPNELTAPCGTGCMDLVEFESAESADLSAWCKTGGRPRTLTETYICHSNGDHNPTYIGLYGVCSAVTAAHMAYDNLLDYAAEREYNNLLDDSYKYDGDNNYNMYGSAYDSFFLMFVGVSVTAMICFCSVLCLCIGGLLGFVVYYVKGTGKSLYGNGVNQINSV